MEGLLKDRTPFFKDFLLYLLNRTKHDSIYTVGFNRRVYISWVMIGSTFNIQRFLDYITAEKKLLTSNQHDTQ